MNNRFFLVAGLALVLVAGAWLGLRNKGMGAINNHTVSASVVTNVDVDRQMIMPVSRAEGDTIASLNLQPSVQGTEQSVDDAGVQAVAAFDAITDKWLDASGREPTMVEVREFVEAYHRVPEAQRRECIHRAINLIPDENVMLLVGVLMDKSISQEIVGEVFKDVVNRDEEVKRPILREIFKDRTHPCWKDAAWILGF